MRTTASRVHWIAAVAFALAGCDMTVSGACDSRRGPNGDPNTSAIAQRCKEYEEVDFGGDTQEANVDTAKTNCEDELESYWKEDGKCKGDPLASCTDDGSSGKTTEFFYEGTNLSFEEAACKPLGGVWKTY